MGGGGGGGGGIGVAGSADGAGNGAGAAGGGGGGVGSSSSCAGLRFVPSLTLGTHAIARSHTGVIARLPVIPQAAHGIH